MREARIDLAAIAANVSAIRAATATPAMVVVKANGYGHGAVESARAAIDGGASWLGVVDVAEALELRAAGIALPVLCWLHDADTDFSIAAENAIDIGVSYLDQLEKVASVEARATVQFKLDTGLSRNGVAEADWERLFARAAQLEASGDIHVRGIFSHLANAGAAADEAQVSRFAAAVELARSAGLQPELVHLAATGGALSIPDARLDLIRIGIGAYGLTPFEAGEPLGVELVPAMQLSASVVSVKRVAAGSGVSYGHSYVTEGASTLALVPLGYADGIPRHASGRAPVWINGRTYAVSGRIAMDQFVVDVGDDPVQVGDRAVLFGNPADGMPAADQWATAADTINYEIVTRIGHRVARRYVS
jgi:alanine racemase